jgi:hypothetical protein
MTVVRRLIAIVLLITGVDLAVNPNRVLSAVGAVLLALFVLTVTWPPRQP